MGRVRKQWPVAGGTVVAALAIMTGLIGVAACSSGPNSAVQVATVGYGTVAQVVQAPANILPKDQVVLAAPADGTVARLDVADGQQVAAGQVLARISAPAATQQLAAAKRAAAQADSAGAGVPATPTGFDTAAANARGASDRAFKQAEQATKKITDPTLRQALTDEITAAQSSYDSAMAAVTGTITEFQQGLASAGQVLSALGQAQETQAQAAVSVAQSTVNALTITAPIAGTVTLGSGQAAAGSSSLGSLSALLAQSGAGQSATQALGAGSGAAAGSAGSGGNPTISVGAPVDSGGTLFTVTDASALSVSAQVDETDVLTVKPGVTAQIQLNAVPGAEYQAMVTAVDPSATESTTGGVTYTVRLSLGAGTMADGSAAPVPLPGMSAIANLNVLTVGHALSVPSAALVTSGDTTTVWLVRNGIAHRQTVQLGAQGDTVVQVVDGLAAGDRIVVAGADVVTDGQQVG
jgi:HlyD family secretion protein